MIINTQKEVKLDIVRCMYGMVHGIKVVNCDMVLEWKFIGGWL